MTKARRWPVLAVVTAMFAAAALTGCQIGPPFYTKDYYEFPLHPPEAPCELHGGLTNFGHYGTCWREWPGDERETVVRETIVPQPDTNEAETLPAPMARPARFRR